MREKEYAKKEARPFPLLGGRKCPLLTKEGQYFAEE